MFNNIETRSITSVSQIKEQAKTVLWQKRLRDQIMIRGEYENVQNRISKAWSISQMWCPGRNYPNWERRGPQQHQADGESRIEWPGSWTIQQVLLLSYMFNPNLLYGAVYMRIYVCIYIYVNVYICICIYNITLYIYIYSYSHLHVYACLLVYMFVYLYVFMCFSVCVQYIYMYN